MLYTIIVYNIDEVYSRFAEIADEGSEINLVLLDGGKVKPLAAVDGTHALNVTGLYGIAAEDAASGEDAVVYLTGEFFAEGLALPDGVAAADIEVALRHIGIFLK